MWGTWRMEELGQNSRMSHYDRDQQLCRTRRSWRETKKVMLKWDGISTLVYIEKLKIGTFWEWNSEEPFNSTDMDYNVAGLLRRVCLAQLVVKLDKFYFGCQNFPFLPSPPCPSLHLSALSELLLRKVSDPSIHVHLANLRWQILYASKSLCLKPRTLKPSNHSKQCVQCSLPLHPAQ